MKDRSPRHERVLIIVRLKLSDDRSWRRPVVAIVGDNRLAVVWQLRWWYVIAKTTSFDSFGVAWSTLEETLNYFRPPTSSSLRITDRSFRYASPCLWNQLPSSLRQPHLNPSVSVLPFHAPTTSSYSVNSPLSPSITPYSRFKTYLFHKFFSP